MIKKPVFLILLVFVTFLCACGNKGQGSTETPYWVENPPLNSFVYFVGKSEKADNYENYLEAKAGALTDVLTQFSIYKGAKIGTTEHSYYSDTSEIRYSSEQMSQMTFNVNSAGLIQQAEWMADDGTLYVLYAFSRVGKIRPLPAPDLPEFFRDFNFRNDRIYFTAMSISKNNTDELAMYAETSAKMQALLWLGIDIKGQYHYTANSSLSDPATEVADLHEVFEGILKCTTSIDLQDLSFREEARHISKERDKNTHFYGLYSISTSLPMNTTEYDYFAYNIHHEQKSAAVSNESFSKQVSFFGNNFSHNRPFDSASDLSLRRPLGFMGYDNPPEGTLRGFGMAWGSTSTEVLNLMAVVEAISKISKKHYAQTQWSKNENGEEQEYGRSSLYTFNCVKIEDDFFDNFVSQLWEFPIPGWIDSEEK